MRCFGRDEVVELVHIVTGVDDDLGAENVVLLCAVDLISPARIVTHQDERVTGGRDDVVVHQGLRRVGMRHALASIEGVEDDAITAPGLNSTAGVVLDVVPRDVSSDVDVGATYRVRLNGLVDADAVVALGRSLDRVIDRVPYYGEVVHSGGATDVEAHESAGLTP